LNKYTGYSVYLELVNSRNLMSVEDDEKCKQHEITFVEWNILYSDSKYFKLFLKVDKSIKLGDDHEYDFSFSSCWKYDDIDKHMLHKICLKCWQ
jgi:hypothetical protein